MKLPELKRMVGDGRFFSVKFRKRTDGSHRTMTCRVGVRPTGGGERSYDPDKHDLLTVWSVRDRGYRSIPVDGILELRAHGRRML